MRGRGIISLQLTRYVPAPAGYVQQGRSRDETDDRLENIVSVSRMKLPFPINYQISSKSPTCVYLYLMLVIIGKHELRNSIMVESEPRRILSGTQQPLKEHTSALEESTYKISGLLSSITRTQKQYVYFHIFLASFPHSSLPSYICLKRTKN